MLVYSLPFKVCIRFFPVIDEINYKTYPSSQFSMQNFLFAIVILMLLSYLEGFKSQLQVPFFMKIIILEQVL